MIDIHDRVYCFRVHLGILITCISMYYFGLLCVTMYWYVLICFNMDLRNRMRANNYNTHQVFQVPPLHDSERM